MITLFCPRCGNRLTVSPNAPQQLRCPRCLNPVANPQGRAHGAAPVPVIPLEYQAHRDSKATGIGAIALLVMVFFGSVTSLLAAPGRIISWIVLLLSLISVFALIAQNAKREAAQSNTSVAQAAARTIARTILGIVMVFGGIILLLLGLCAAVIVMH
jgi:hypothetical protein